MFKYFLNFEETIGRVEISEPFGADALTYSLSQNDHYGRDIFKGGNEDLSLSFYPEHFEKSAIPLLNIYGVEINHLSHGFDFLKNELERKGWELKVQFIINYDNSDKIIGYLSGYSAQVKHDELSFRIIQNNNYEILKRRSDVYVNAFSDKDLDGNTITPCSTSNILLKSKPTQLKSKWGSFIQQNTGVSLFGLNHFYVLFPSFAQLQSFEIKSSRVAFEPTYNTDPLIDDADRDTIESARVLVKAFNPLSNIKIKIKGFACNFIETTSSTFGIDFGLSLKYGHTDNGFNTSNGQIQQFFSGTSSLNVPKQDVEFTIPNLNINEKISLAFFCKDNNGAVTAPSISSTFDYSIEHDGIEIEVVSTSIDTIVKGVRLIDLMKHSVKSIVDLPLIAEKYDVNGEHYNNFVMNGFLLTQNKNRALNTQFKDIINILEETNHGYQINSENIEFLPFESFYKDEEIFDFDELPNEIDSYEFDEKAFLKTLEFGYTKSSFERETNGSQTNDDVHTSCQFMFPTKFADNNLKRELKFIRSAHLLEEARAKIQEDKKSNQNDESLFLLDCVSLNSNVQKSFSAFLAHNNNKILSNGSFDFSLLGFDVGASISINGQPTTVVGFDGLVMEVSTSYGVGEQNFTFSYTLSNVQFENRTNEGFEFIDGVFQPNNYSNLRYSIKRNLKNYESLIATASAFNPNGEIKNTLFRINDKLETRLTGETAVLKDKDSFFENELREKRILSPRIHEVTNFLDFKQADAFFKDVQEKKGYISFRISRDKKIKCFPIEVTHSPNTYELKMKLVEKYENNFIEIRSVSLNKIAINNETFENIEFQINNNFVSLYDSKSVLIKIDYFDKFKIDGASFVNAIDFADKLINII